MSNVIEITPATFITGITEFGGLALVAILQHRHDP
jgi:hypothetical protein